MTRTLLAILGTICLLGGVSLWMLTDHVLPAIVLVLASIILFCARKSLKAQRISEA